MRDQEYQALNIQRDYNAQFYKKNKECFTHFKIPLFIKYHHLEQGDGTALEGNALTADISRFCTVLASPEEGQPSAEPPLCPSVTWSPSRVCSVSRRTPRCLSALQKQPHHPPGGHHPLTGILGVFRASTVAGFSSCLALVRKFSVFHICMAEAAEGKDGEKLA